MYRYKCNKCDRIITKGTYNGESYTGCCADSLEGGECILTRVHEPVDFSIEQKILAIADAIQMLTCMISVPEYKNSANPEASRRWFEDKLKGIFQTMGDIRNA